MFRSGRGRIGSRGDEVLCGRAAALSGWMLTASSTESVQTTVRDRRQKVQSGPTRRMQ